MIYHLILLSIFIFPSNASDTFEETYYFDVVWNNDKVIGSLKASRTAIDSRTYYQSATTINTRIITNIRVNYKYDVVFNNKHLEMADVNITVNKKSHAQTNTQWTGTNYHIVKNDKKYDDFKKFITYSTIQLYFEEPLDVKSCYSEQEGDFDTIIALGNHTYNKVNAKGHKNIYFYKAGRLEKATIDGGIIKFNIVARN